MRLAIGKKKKEKHCRRPQVESMETAKKAKGVEEPAKKVSHPRKR